MNRKIAFLVIFIFLIFLCSSCFAYTENISSVALQNTSNLTFESCEDFLNYIINYGDTDYYTINEILNSNWFIYQSNSNNAYYLYFNVSDTLTLSVNSYVLHDLTLNNNHPPCLWYLDNIYYTSNTNATFRSNRVISYLTNTNLYYDNDIVYSSNYTPSIPEEPEEPEEPQEDYTTLIQYNNQLLEINNTMLIIIIFLILIYWLGKMFYMFFKATIL